MEEKEQLKAEIERLNKLVDYWESETKVARREIDEAVKDTVNTIADWLDNEKGFCGIGWLVKRQFLTENKQND